jgi:hypothetical protein
MSTAFAREIDILQSTFATFRKCGAGKINGQRTADYYMENFC